MPQPLGSQEVDVIEARAAQGNEPDPRVFQRLKHGLVQPVVDERAHGVGVRHERHRLFRQSRLKESQLMTGLAIGGEVKLSVVAV